MELSGRGIGNGSAAEVARAIRPATAFGLPLNELTDRNGSGAANHSARKQSFQTEAGSAAAEAGIRITLLDTCYLHGGLSAEGEYLEPNEVQQRFGDRRIGRCALDEAGMEAPQQRRSIGQQLSGLCLRNKGQEFQDERQIVGKFASG